MNQTIAHSPTVARRRARGLVLGVAAATLLVTAAHLQAGPPGFTITKPEPGGLIGRPIITSVSNSADSTTLNWTGLLGPYQVEQSSTLAPGSWQPVGAPVAETTVVVPKQSGMGFLRINAPQRSFLSADKCGLCHEEKYNSWTNTAHHGALGSLKAIGQGANAFCLPCHTVGAGRTGGFKDEATTPALAGVQCENCHGPAGGHSQKTSDVTKQPVITLSAKVCGGCHSDAHHPTFEEWETTLHAEVSPDVAVGILSTNAATSSARMLACGPCHSGAVRQALLAAAENQVAPVLPNPKEAAEIGVTCVVCHDPHESTAHGSQLRYPKASMADYTYSTSTNTTFAAQYNPNIVVCGQCHNSRNAAWTDTSRSPHYSPQYNIVIGTRGYYEGTNAPPQSPHRDIPNQCAHCHTHPHSVAQPTEANPNFTGHDFAPRMTSCEPCHDAEEATLFTESTQTYTKSRIATVKGLLEQWALTKAPADLKTKYGSLAWEYTSIGNLSTPTPTVTAGPNSTEQKSIPDAVKQARYNLYLVSKDGSGGVHNGRYTRFLLKVAEDKVNALLAQ